MKKKNLIASSLLAATLFQSIPAAAFSTRQSAAVQHQTSEGTLTNGDVVMMLKSGFSHAVITAKIKTSICKFDTSVAALQQLKEAGATDQLIVSMVEAAAAPSRQQATLIQRPVAAPAQVQQAPAQQLAPGEIKIPEGTVVEVQTAHTISSADYEVGSPIGFTVVQPVKINGVTVIEQGASATARIVKAEGGKSFGRSGKLSWEMKEVTAIDGSKVPLTFNKGVSGSGAGGTVATGIIVTSLLFWPAAPLWGFKKGKAAVLPAGKRFDSFVHGAPVVKVAVNRPGEEHNRAGMAYFTQQNFIAAEASFRQAVMAEPGNAFYHHNLGTALSGQQRYEEAEAEMHEAVRLSPGEKAFADSLNMVVAARRNTRRAIRVQ